MKTKPFSPIFHEADKGGAPAMPAINVPEIPAAGAAPKVTEVSVPANDNVIDAAKTLGIKVVSPKDAGFGDSVAEMEAMETAAGKKPVVRDEKGKFASKDPKDKPAEKPVVKEPEAPVAKIAEPVKEPVAAKLKIGDKEFDEKDVAARFKELDELKAKKPEVAEKKEEPKPTLTPEQQKDADKKADDDFITSVAAEYSIDEIELDKILAGGKDAISALASVRAKDALALRKWVTDQFNPIISSLHENIKPVLDMQRQVSQYQTEAQILEQFPDIASHEKGREEMRKVDADMHSYYDRVQRLISANAANDEETKWAKTFESLTPEAYREDLAFHTRARLGIKEGAAPEAKAETQPAAVKEPEKPIVKAQPKPLSSDRPGGAGAGGKQLSKEQIALAEMNAHEGL